MNIAIPNKKTIVTVSGGFDPIHVGHVRMFQQAKGLGDELIVIINNDNWLRAKKEIVFMPQEERMEIIRALECVDGVILTQHEKDPKDMSVAKELKQIRPDIFANGGDRGKHNTPEKSVCREIDCEMIYNIGGGKIQSSSWLLEDYKKNFKFIKQHYT